MSTSALPYPVLYNGSLSLVSTTFVSGIAWGVMTCLYSVCMYSIFRSGNASKKASLLTAWITTLWASSSLSTVANAYCTLYAYSWQLNYPGGPITYLANEWNKPMPVLAYTTYILTMWSADAFMLWRLAVFTRDFSHPIRIATYAIASLLYIGTVGTGCFTITILLSGQTLFSEYAQKAAIPCFTLSVTLNVFVTTVIAVRLRRLGATKIPGPQEASYSSAWAVFTESSALYAIWSFVFIILYAVNNPGQDVMLMTLTSVQVIAPLLIVYRMSKGTSWEQRASAAQAQKEMMFTEL